MSIDEWEIKIECLPGPNRNEWAWLEDRLYYCEQTDIACLIYSIGEISMGWDVGMLAVYRNKKNPELILNPKHLLCYGISDTVEYFNNGELGFVKIYAYYEHNLECPICILNFREKRFAVLPIINGFNYNFIQVGLSEYKLIEKQHDDRFTSLTGNIIDKENLQWHDWGLLDDFSKWYFDNKHLL